MTEDIQIPSTVGALGRVEGYVEQERGNMPGWLVSDLLHLCAEVRRRGRKIDTLEATPPAAPVAEEFVRVAMEKAQEFASAWSLVGGRFDDGSMLEEAGKRKDELRALIAQQTAKREARTAEQALTAAGVFKGAAGLRGLAESQEFWDRQMYGTHLYFGDGIADYLHRGVLKEAVRLLDNLHAAHQSHDAAGEEPIDLVRFRQAPCYLCGYNGAGYFQPDTHPCAKAHHKENDCEPPAQPSSPPPPHRT